MISEATVIAVAAALYLFDCMVLLDRGQAVLEAKWSHVGIAFGSKHYQIAGKAVALLNPFTPFFPAVRTLPLFSIGGSSAVKASLLFKTTTTLSILSFVQAMLVFVAMPLFLYRAPGWPFLIALLLAYLNAVAMLGLIWLRFGKARIAKRPLVALGFGWLVCLPLSVNCLRRAGLACNIAMDARRALRFLPTDERQQARAELAAQIAEALQETDESDDLHRRLAELKRQLTPEASDGRT